MILAHTIKHNDTTRVPRRFLWLATEATTEERGSARFESWKLAVTAYDGWDEHKKERRPVRWRRHDTHHALWDYVDGISRANQRTVLTCHELSYHLRIARAFEELPQFHWKLVRLGMHDRSLTISWKRADGATLVMCDSGSWLPGTLENIVRLVGKSVESHNYSHPAGLSADTPANEVNFVRAAMLHLYDWIERDDLGTWAKTGATMAWNNWRHRHLTHKVIVHDSFEAQAAEEQSTYAGRCEAWRWGKVRGGPFVEYDMAMAYPRACLDNPLPIQYAGWVRAPQIKQTGLARSATRRLYRAEVVTDQPVLPMHTADGIVWPVGVLVGWWWDDELTVASKAGAKITLLECHVYGAAPALTDWAKWVIQGVEDRTNGWTEVQRAAAKHWSRALIGRFATRYRNWQVLGEAPTDEITLMDCLDHDTHGESEILFAGGEAWWCDHRELGRDAVPAIQSAVISECRIRLWRIMQAAGLEHVIYCDTDSVIVDTQGSGKLLKAIIHGNLWGLRKIRTIKSLEVEGPRQLVADGVVRYAGIPRRATRDLEGGFAGERRESFESSLREGRAGEVVTRSSPWAVRGVDRRREHLADGSTRAVKVG